jgi:hypothetical protein
MSERNGESEDHSKLPEEEAAAKVLPVNSEFLASLGVLGANVVAIPVQNSAEALKLFQDRQAAIQAQNRD